MDFSGLRGLVVQVHGDPAADGGEVAGQALQLHGDGAIGGVSLVFKDLHGGIVDRDGQVDPSIIVDVNDGQALGVAGHDQTGSIGPDRFEGSISVASQQQAQSAVHASGLALGPEEVLDDDALGFGSRDIPLTNQHKDT